MTLSGEVANFDEMDKIEEAAWAVPGVKMVVNQLTIRWPSPTSSARSGTGLTIDERRGDISWRMN